MGGNSLKIPYQKLALTWRSRTPGFSKLVVHLSFCNDRFLGNKNRPTMGFFLIEKYNSL